MAAPVDTAPRTTFFHEGQAYALLAEAGMEVPRHGWGAEAPFAPGEAVVVKGLAEELWHKSELGCVRFEAFDPDHVIALADAMRARVAAVHRWVGALVCERAEIRHPKGLPGEAFAALTRGEGGWTLVLGFGGLQAEALAELAPPLLWPLAWVRPEEALAELGDHLLGRAWLGRLRQGEALVTRDQLLAFLQGLWRAAALAEEEGLDLLELNPVAVDATGRILPLDGVGRYRSGGAARLGPPEGFMDALCAPRTVALAGVSSRAGSVGRIILDNLRLRPWPEGDLRLVKPATDRFLDLPCIPDVAPLRDHPVDLLILALPAPLTLEALGQLVAQGGGAATVMLVAGGIGDGADTEGHAGRVTDLLSEARAAGRWTPALLGPNCLGHVVPSESLETLFIPQDKVALPRPGHLALLSQSGAFLLSRLSRNPALGLGLALALGNQLDVRLSDALQGLAARPELKAVGAYVEGFPAGELADAARAAASLREAGVPTLLYRAGRTASGQAAAASHTGAMAGDQRLEQAVLRRAGVKVVTSQAAFEAGLGWLGAQPALGLHLGPVALLSNAGFESVTFGDLADGHLPQAILSPEDTTALAALLEAHGLAGLVSPRLPLDLTPMADDAAFEACADFLLARGAEVLVLGLIPFTERLKSSDPAAVEAFGGRLMTLAAARGKALGAAVDAGPDYETYRAALTRAGLPIFRSVEEALLGLRALA